MTLQYVADEVGRLGEARQQAGDKLKAPTSMTHTTLSRIERGLQPYNQVLLEILAEIYQTDVASLITRDPKDGPGIWSIYFKLSPSKRRQMAEIAETIHRADAER